MKANSFLLCYARILPAKFRARILPENAQWGYLSSYWEKKSFQIHREDYSYRTWKALYTLDLLYNQLFVDEGRKKH